MEYQEIEMNQRGQIEYIRRKYGHYLLSHSFCTLILWKETLKLSIHLEEDFFVVKYETNGENSYFFPCGNDEKKRQFIDSMLGTKDFAMYYMAEEDKQFVEKYYNGRLQTEYDRGGCEYIFDRAGHVLLKGKTYAKIRYEQNHLLSSYEVRSIPMTPEMEGQVLEIIEEWEQEHQLHHAGEDDYEVAKSALKYFNEMQFIGNLVYVNDIPYAIAIGGEITEDTFGIQIAKTRSQIGGLMFYLLHKCFELIPARYLYINGDDDMNVEGIRIHKKKMKPCRMNEVWKVFWQEAEDGR